MKLWVLLVFPAAIAAQTAVTTAQYDNARTGANANEAVLSPRNVNAGQFGKLFHFSVEGDVYAQPLYVPHLDIPGYGVRDVVFAATEGNHVYAFDAGGNPRTPLWKVSFGKPLRWSDVACSFIDPEIGITSTPVIDVATRTMYVLARTRETTGGTERFYQRLHALDIATGAERPGSPVLIRAAVDTTWFFGLLHDEVTFHAVRENPRAALLLVKGNVYIAWGSSCDVGPYHGWVLAYDARTLRQTGVFNASPEGNEGGIWQSDTGIAGDAEGNVYAVTGNGKFTAHAGGRDYGDTVLKLGFERGALAVKDFFTSFDQADLNRRDDDLGSGGPVLLPDGVMVAAGKTGVLYLLDRNRMGKFQPGSNNVRQAFKAVEGGIYGAPAYWNGHLYLSGSEDVLKEFRVVGGRIAALPAHRAVNGFGNPGAIPVVSANGTKDGVVWCVQTKDHREGLVIARLHAYDAEDVGRELYSDTAGTALRFAMPTVAGGRVYVGAKDAVAVFGLLEASPRSRRRSSR